MQCANCQTTNPEGAKFCLNCGSAMSIACRNCGTSLAPRAKFCFNCGQAVADDGRRTTDDSRPQASVDGGRQATQTEGAELSQEERLQQYIPKELLNKLQAARANRSMAGERRIVTVLFCDVKGSTAMAEQLDPEDWAEIMNGVFQYLIEPVYRYEGTLARLMGDAILAFFGAPIAHEDDPQRAVLAALGILEGIQPYREKIKRERGFDFDVRVGINTGLVVVGEVGSDLRVEYTAMGDAVNLASRMEQTAEPGTVQITGNTYKSVSNLFEFNSLGGIEVKGKVEPVEAYQVLSVREGALPTRGIEGLTSPMVGRERELATLRSAIEDLIAGRGQIVSITGEAGLGKSRLVSELKKWIAQGDKQQQTSAVRWHEGRSMSYETSTPYAPFIHLFGDIFGLRADDSDAEKYDKVRAGVTEAMPGSEAEIAPLLGNMLGIKLTGDAAERVDYLQPPMLRGRVFYAVAGFIEAIATREPLVLMFEDLHWVDPTSLELIEQLLPITDRAMLMVLALFRPQAQEPSWRFHEIGSRDFVHRYTRIAIEPLGAEGARQLVANLLEIEDLPEAVRALILTKAEGNPFFVEEVIRSLLDAKLVVREDNHWRATREIANIAVPDTLAGVITARLDRLDEEAKHVAQTASVVGREFAFDVLGEVYDAPQAVDSALSSLQRRELVRERSRMPRRLYLFKHVLTQETAYATVLLSKRRELHLRVGECLERIEPERVQDISRHLLEAREAKRALPYLVKSGEMAARAGAHTEATGYFRKAVEVVQTDIDIEMARRAYEGLGKVLEFSRDIPGAFETYHNMLHYAEEHNDAPMQVSALNKMSFLHALVMGQFPEAESHLAQAEKLAYANDDADGLYELYNMKCNMCLMVADFSTADRYLTEAVDLGRKTNRLDNLAYGLAHKSNTLGMMARFDESWEVAQEALTVSDEAGNLQFKANALGEAITMYFISKGDLDEAFKRALEGYEIATRIGAAIESSIPTLFMGAIAAMRGEYELAMRWINTTEELGRMLANMFPFMLAMGLGRKSAISLEMGPAMLDKSLDAQAETLSMMQTPGGMPAGGTGWPDLGFCALAQGDIEAAARYFENGLTMPSIMMNVQRPRTLCGAALAALAHARVGEGVYLMDAARYVDEARKYAQEHSMKDMMPLVELTEGHVKEAKGDCEGALACYNQAEKVGMEMTMRPVVVKAREAASHVLSTLGRIEESQEKSAQARAMVDEIASLFKDDNLKASYLESMGQVVGSAH